MMLDWLEAAQQRLEASVQASGDLTLSPGDIAYLVEFAHGRSPHAQLRFVIATALGDASPQADGTAQAG